MGGRFLHIAPRLRLDASRLGALRLWANPCLPAKVLREQVLTFTSFLRKSLPLIALSGARTSTYAGDRLAVSRMPRAGRVILPLAWPNRVEDEVLALTNTQRTYGVAANGATSRAELDSVQPFCAVMVRRTPRKPPNSSAPNPRGSSARDRLRRRPYRSPFRIRLRKYSAARIPDSAAPSMKPWKLWKLSVCSPANARFPSGSPTKPSIVVK